MTSTRTLTSKQLLGDLGDFTEVHRIMASTVAAASKGVFRPQAEMAAQMARLFPPKQSAFDILEAAGLKSILANSTKVSNIGKAASLVLEQSAAARIMHGHAAAEVAKAARMGMLLDQQSVTGHLLLAFKDQAKGAPALHPRPRPATQIASPKPDDVPVTEADPEQRHRAPVVTYVDLAVMLVLVYQVAALILEQSNRDRLQVSAATAVAVAVWVVVKGATRR